MSFLVALARVSGLFSLPLLLHLFLVFPQPSRWLERWPSLRIWLYVPFCLFVLPTFGVSRLPIRWSTPFFNSPVMHWLGDHGLLLAGYLTLLGYLLAALISLGLGYKAADLAGRRRLRVVMWGSLIGFGSLFLIIVMESTNTQERFATIWKWLEFSTIVTLPLVPLSFGYAIIRHRVIPISLILRRGARYVLVLRGAILLEVIVAIVLVMVLLSWLIGRFQMSPLLIAAISGVASVLAWQFTRTLRRRYLSPVIDKQFFRQSYDAQQVLAELSESLHTASNITQVLKGSSTSSRRPYRPRARRFFCVMTGQASMSARMAASTTRLTVVQCPLTGCIDYQAIQQLWRNLPRPAYCSNSTAASRLSTCRLSTASRVSFSKSSKR
jgi:hypothetical protein